MKKSILLLFPILLISCKTVYYSFNLDNEKDVFVPLGDSETLFISKFEVSNYEYGLFLSDVKVNDPDLWQEVRYDSTLWVSKNISKHWVVPTSRHYHRHYHFDNYPIVNIPLSGAQKYCHWLTKEYHKENKRKFKKVIFRLPTENEFISIINSTNIHYHSDNPEDYKKIKVNLEIRYKETGYVADGGMFTNYVYLNPQTRSGICSIIGNVAEFTSEGKVLGGSFGTLPSKIDEAPAYEAPDPRIGFRIVMEVIEK